MLLTSLQNALKMYSQHAGIAANGSPGHSSAQSSQRHESVTIPITEPKTTVDNVIMMPGAFAFTSIASPVDAITARLSSLDIEDRAPSISQLSAQMASTHLDGGASSPIPSVSQMASVDLEGRNNSGNSFTRVQEEDSVPAELEPFETLVAAATLTATPMDISTHNKLFMSSAEHYQNTSSTLPSSLHPLDVSDAVESLEALFTPNPKKSSVLPAFRPSPRFGRSPIPGHTLVRDRSRSVSPSSRSSPDAQSLSPAQERGKIERDELKVLDTLNKEFDCHYARVFDDAFTMLPIHSKIATLEAASGYLNRSLARIQALESKEKERLKKAKYRSNPERSHDKTPQEARDKLRERLKGFYAKICVLNAPLVSEKPINVDAGHVHEAEIVEMDQINQVLILLSIICNVIIGLSVVNTNFVAGVATLLVKLGMSTNSDSKGSSLAHQFSPSQNEIIADMPSSLHDALKKLNVDGRFELFAACPSCNFTNEAETSATGQGFYGFPHHCSNHIVGEHSVSKCGAKLLFDRKDGTSQPIKPYLVSSLPDYLVRCLADPFYLQQCTNATDTALDAIRTGEEQALVGNVFQAEFIKDFRGPDGKLFVDRGDKIRLAFSLHMDFFNPNGITHRGPIESLGVISAANLALDSSLRYLPECIFPAALIPGKFEPNYDENDHYVRRVVEQFKKAWRPGFNISRTAASESPTVVEAAILLSVNYLPAARKIAGFQGSSATGFICSRCRKSGAQSVTDTDHDHWILRDVEELRHWSKAYRDAQTIKERQRIYETHGVRWSSLWELEYWDPTKMLVIDAMHCVLEGVVHYHCRHVLRLDASAKKFTAEGLEIAYDWPWLEYDHEAVPTQLKLEDKHIPGVSKIQRALCLSLEGKKALTLNALWTRIDHAGTLGALRFVAFTLSLPDRLIDICDEVANLYVARSKKAQGFPAEQVAKRKNHFVALLMNWRLKQPKTSDAYIIPTGTPETLDHIQTVIRKTVTPSWLNSVPRNYGEASAGSIKADEWRTLSTVYLPIALIILWGDDGGLAPPNDDTEQGYLLRALDHTMALFQATAIAYRYTMTADRVNAYRQLVSSWVKNLHGLYPHTRNGGFRPNIHAAQHIYDFLLLFGPVLSWWCFPFERLIGVIQKINTNNRIGGVMESSLIKTMARTANLRRWLHRPDCPEAILQLKRLFDKAFPPVNGVEETQGLPEMKGPHRAYARHDGVNFSPCTTHTGNASIIYRPSPGEPALAGQIQNIINVTSTSVRVHVRPYEPLLRNAHDPFLRYPYLSATTYSSTLREKADVIELDDIIAHAARYDYSLGRSVLVNLSRQ